MKPLKEYIIRMGKSRGFGVQSPWAYSFVRDVIFERLPYYEYKEIEACYSDSGEQKWQKLLYRLRNYARGDKFSIIDFASNTDEEIKERLSDLGERGMIVLKGVSADYSRWLTLEKDSAIGISFDLYEKVIVFAPQKGRTKQCYKFNF